MSKYQHAKIYALKTSQSDMIYIGSTINSLKKRFDNHKNDYMRFFNNEHYFVTSFFILGFEDVHIELIEDCPCSSKQELLRREGEIIQKYPNAVNRCIAGRTKEESAVISQYNYYWRNREKRIANAKKWNQQNKEKHAYNSRMSYWTVKIK